MPMNPGEPTRRRALWTFGAAGITLLAASDGVRQVSGPVRPQSSAPAARARQVLHGSGSPSPAPSPTPTPTPPLPGHPGWTPTPIPRRRKPVINLRELPGDRPARAISLTIDDGPHPVWTPRMLELLAEHKITATFFAIGIQVKEFPDVLRKVVDAGHEICNHTMHHPIAIDHLPTRRVTAELRDAHARIADITGRAPRFFRAPGGRWNRRVLEITAEYGMTPIHWEIDPSDWSTPGVGHIRSNLLGCHSGSIMLCHDGGGDRSQTLAALRTVIPQLKKRGLTFVAL